MNLTQLTQGEPWMTPEEQDVNRELIRAITDLLTSGGVPETPFIALRVNDVVATWFLARRLESALAPAEGEPPPCPTPAQAGAIGKCRERLRKAMKELETCLVKTSTPAPQSIDEFMHHSVHKIREAGFPLDSTGNSGNANQQHESPDNPEPVNNAVRENAPRENTPRENAPRENVPNKRRQTGGYRAERIRANPSFRSTMVSIYPESPPAPGAAPVPSAHPNRQPRQDTG